MEFKEEEHILNAGSIIDHFGYWPTFHDAEVISISFQRNFKDSNSTLEFQLYAFIMTSKVKGRHFELIKHCLIDFELADLHDNSMDGFNHQNALSRINFYREGDLLVCELSAAYGVDAKFTSKHIRVKKLTPIASGHF
ncbi:Imm50 family immunity protein [Paracnuella aquatica]|uniref:Imm50 family immunity protein n=1 Tax=Paracnuella aquatica TaxID=2268757 RepID=UPI000DEF0E4F|nr:Imm50 family immunity protein [Paracnuella aquatica]RPD51846.1 hypothetical protein DRJ53_03985 [Paracnuella aquatica]